MRNFISSAVGKFTSGGYRSSRILRRVDQSRAPVSSSFDSHADYSRADLVAFSRMFIRDNPLYKGMLGRCTSYVIGGGYELQARTRSPELNNHIEALWDEFWASPEIRGTLSGRRLESLIFTELLTTGDAFLMFVDDGGGKTKLQVFESEQCTPATFNKGNGIELDKFGRALRYNLVGYNEQGKIPYGKKNLCDAEDVIHMYDLERASASRGVPALQSSFAMLHRINAICDAEAIARQMLSHMTLAISKDAPNYGDNYTEGAVDDGSGNQIVDIDYATLIHLAPGEAISNIDRNIPGGDFEQSMRLFLRMLGLPLGLPLEIVLLDWTQSNYSQSRAVLQQAFQTFGEWQQIQKDKFLTRVYHRKMAEWLDKGLLPDNVPDLLKHEWVAPSFPWIDEKKEIEAQREKVKAGVMSQSEVCKMRQVELEDVRDQRVVEIEDAIKRTQALEEEYGVKVPWQTLCDMEIVDDEPDTAIVVD